MDRLCREGGEDLAGVAVVQGAAVGHELVDHAGQLVHDGTSRVRVKGLERSIPSD